MKHHDPDIPASKPPSRTGMSALFRTPGNPSHGTRLLGLILVASLLIGTAGWAFTKILMDYGETNERQHLLARTHTGAAALDPGAIALLQGTPGERALPGHILLRSQLKGIRKANPDIRFVYIMAKRNSRIVFLADAEPMDSKDYSTPGDVYQEASAELVKSFSTGNAFTEGPLKDRWGVWVSAIVPIPSADGAPVAVLGMDVHAGKWQDAIGVYQWFGITITGLLEVLILLFIVILHQTTLSQKTMKAANDRLMESKDLFDSFMKNLPAYAFIKDRTGAYIYANKSIDYVMNSDPEKRLGQTDDTLFPPDIAKALKANDETVLKTGIIFEGMETVTDNHGRSCPQLVIKFPVMVQGIPAFVGGVALDMSRQINAEQDRDRLKNLLASITGSMPSALMALDTRMKILHWNREAEKLTGILPEKVLGKTLDEVLPMETELLDFVAKALDVSTAAALTNRIKHTPQGAIYQDITAYPLNGDHFQGIVVRIDDVTRRVTMERMIIQSEKMVSIGGLAAGMAHEINNPLAGMMQNAQVIMNRLSTDLPVNESVARDLGTTMAVIHEFMKRRDILKFLESIHGAGTHAARIVQNMLNFAQKNTSTKSYHNPSHLLDKTIELAENDYSLKKKFDFRKTLILRKYDPDPPDLLCEASNLQQVFFNIIRNAAEAMHSNPDPQAQPTMTLRLMTDGPWVVIEIQDNGPGMDEETRKRVFEPFFTTKDPDKGTGLGLSVSYFIVVQDHGGTMGVDSLPGKGTTFRIRLPLTPRGDAGDGRPM
ncbi:MAG: ATP-binding protein [Pseudomonadota bacterium]